MSAVIQETKTLDEKMAQDRSQAGKAFANGLAFLKKEDQAPAYSEFKRAAELGHVPAKAKLAYCHKMGIGTKPDFFGAFNMLQELRAQYTEKKLVAETERQKAEQLKNTTGIDQADKRLQLLQIKYAEANYQLARFYHLDFYSFKKEWLNPILAIELFTEAANGNHAEALHYIGTFQMVGSYTIEKNEKQAYRTFTKSATLGCDRAYFELGLFHESGVVGDETLDKMKAGIFYKQAADAGHAGACLKTGICLAEGILGLEEAPFEAFRYLKKASDNIKADASIRPEALIKAGEILRKLEEKFSDLNKKVQAAEESERKLRADLAERDKTILDLQAKLTERDKTIAMQDASIIELEAQVETLRGQAARAPGISMVSEGSRKRPHEDRDGRYEDLYSRHDDQEGRRKDQDSRAVTVQYDAARASPAKRSRTYAMGGNTQAIGKEAKHESEKNKTEKDRSKMSVSKPRKYPRLSLESR